ncbi:MAG: hypothetical protein CO064_10980 [Anaerolineae bacterium CG_4_9_14_0_8_um_filter_58_9]|nr:MAG: hypothetical protein CO064_10980 [Anaerolineae bacterium CG_4_9_14_0_8_um_filter_58_9]
MSTHSGIEWTESTWNPLTGCTKISPGCSRCYAERMAKRLQAMGQPNYANGFKLAMHEHALEKPLEWKTPQVVFVNSMSDLFHKDVPVEFIQKTFDVMRRAHWHQFQVLTKRSERLLELDGCQQRNHFGCQQRNHFGCQQRNHFPQIEWPENVWMGVSVENQDYTFRIDHLRQTGAKVKFLSLEPLLGPLHLLDLGGINWVIVGGESGPGARPIQEKWVKEIRDQCLTVKVPFFFKQWGGVRKKQAGRSLEGRTWDEMPVNLTPARA